MSRLTANIDIDNKAARLLIKIITVNELKTIVYYSVNSATCFGLRDQHQADQQYDSNMEIQVTISYILYC